MNGQEAVDSRIVDPARLPFAYADALNAGDADAVLALFHQDATMRTFTGEVLTDREALRAETVNSIAAQARLTNEPRFTQIGGDTALIIVDWNLEGDVAGRHPDLAGRNDRGRRPPVGRRVVAVHRPQLSRDSRVSRVADNRAPRWRTVEVPRPSITREGTPAPSRSTGSEHCSGAYPQVSGRPGGGGQAGKAECWRADQARSSTAA